MVADHQGAGAQGGIARERSNPSGAKRGNAAALAYSITASAVVSLRSSSHFSPMPSMAGNRPLCKAMPMPRYFFNTRIGHDLISDPKGADLRDPDHAWEMARAMIVEILRDQRGQPGLLTAILEVTDERGEMVLELPFSEALIPPPDEPPTKH
jgi:hypothetical protein